MSVSITIKSGTWVARDKGGQWWGCLGEMFYNERFDVWDSGTFVDFDLPEELLDLSSFPTFAEPDWRKTKFQVQA